MTAPSNELKIYDATEQTTGLRENMSATILLLGLLLISNLVFSTVFNSSLLAQSK